MRRVVITGIGAVKLERYGDAVLEVILAHAETEA